MKVWKDYVKDLKNDEIAAIGFINRTHGADNDVPEKDRMFYTMPDDMSINTFKNGIHLITDGKSRNGVLIKEDYEKEYGEVLPMDHAMYFLTGYCE
jgi:hypothetical protein